MRDGAGDRGAISFPPCGQRRQGGGTELRVDIFPAPKDHVAIVSIAQQGRHIAVTCVGPALPAEWSRHADALVVVRQVAGSVSFNLFGISAEGKMRKAEGQLGRACQAACSSVQRCSSLKPLRNNHDDRRGYSACHCRAFLQFEVLYCYRAVSSCQYSNKPSSRIQRVKAR